MLKLVPYNFKSTVNVPGLGFGNETQLVAAGEVDESLTIKVDVFSEEIIGKEVYV